MKGRKLLDPEDINCICKCGFITYDDGVLIEESKVIMRGVRNLAYLEVTSCEGCEDEEIEKEVN